MAALIIGADKLGNIPEFLHKQGIEEIIHWDGRKKGMRKMDIPEDIGMVICLYDFLEHRLTERVKKVTKDRNIPCVFARRSISDLSKQWDRCQNCRKCLVN
ncbi:DUF2325 domain-containing protein [Acidaminobacter sp. JC074]|uniref:DUF2325 domain-containing protein n=1 Tax=Acidaminobacter sp. JC074 TaxID=2530199 RepID=UPI001F111E26|nr:DUF2325 domain-containing protein [Acidaminobacter sp. JC074]MCH4888325.1 DUF2325 domain-containing protein [Acidaminobacter sp. JC074]